MNHGTDVLSFVVNLVDCIKGVINERTWLFVCAGKQCDAKHG
ncbi:MAG: hypothetical protein RLZZ352_295 [Pseudomonadota bacterium]|jgi:hypothetical protein